MMVTALELDGHMVEAASDATEGLSCLQRQHYDLVLSDYAMPGGTGTWMLGEAAKQALLVHTAALIITASPDIKDFAGLEVISKPLDLEPFLQEVRRLVSRAAP